MYRWPRMVVDKAHEREFKVGDRVRVPVPARALAVGEPGEDGVLVLLQRIKIRLLDTHHRSQPNHETHETAR